MGRIGVLVLSWCLTIAALVRPAAAGDFPKNLAFLKGLPVVITGECLFDSDGRNVRFGPCEARVAKTKDAGGAHLFYLMEATATERLDGIQSFTLSTREVAPPARLRGDITVVVRGTCSGRELGLETPSHCSIAVYPVDGADGPDERIFLRLTRSLAPVRVEFFELYRGVIIPAERPAVRTPERKGGDVGVLLLADVLVIPGMLQDLPPELSYLELFHVVGTLPCRDPAGARAGICQVLRDPETRIYYFLMYRDERLRQVWRVDTASRRSQVLWSTPPCCNEGDLCA